VRMIRDITGTGKTLTQPYRRATHRFEKQGMMQ
jgi:hypothetical protein